MVLYLSTVYTILRSIFDILAKCTGRIFFSNISSTIQYAYRQIANGNHNVLLFSTFKFFYRICWVELAKKDLYSDIDETNWHQQEMSSETVPHSWLKGLCPFHRNSTSWSRGTAVKPWFREAAQSIHCGILEIYEEMCIYYCNNN